uniref:Lipopolysaccharide biosynthesis protein n=1 Tax=uncultured bacterium A1Q1_fos_4 TaxID=1256574 RepID=L7VWF3_9BACT|nr:lipopolysaccharide biosynthesis protein [uncultured bacterium A1Q1_fos_4]
MQSNESLTKQIVQLQAEIRALKESHSWRITAPLRWLRKPVVTSVANANPIAEDKPAPELEISAPTDVKAYEERIATLRTDTFVLHGNSKAVRRIAYFAENDCSSTYRYRAANMAAVLNDATLKVSDNQELHASAACFYSADLPEHAQQIAECADILVISRARYDENLAHLVHLFKEQHKRVLYDIDDLVFDVDEIDLIIDTLGQAATDEVLNYWFSIVARMGKALRMCDGAFTTNNFLARKLQHFLPPTASVHVVPNFINQKQSETSQLFYQRKLDNMFATNGRIKFGYFSGSATHNKDLALMAPALVQLMLMNEQVDLLLVGHVDIALAFGSDFSKMVSNEWAHRVTLIPFTDYLTLQSLISEVDFNLVPLQSNDFTNCKSELKFFDAAAVGTPTLASPTFAYEHAITHTKTGYLVEDSAWLKELSNAANFRINDVHGYATMAQAAHAEVQQRYIWNTQREAIFKALNIKPAT